MSPTALPYEILEFEQLLRKPNSDPTGLASFFNGGEVWVTRVPARLDVMGGIADYSGANVCEAVLGRGVLMALQPRTDRTLRIRTMQAGLQSAARRNAHAAGLLQVRRRPGRLRRSPRAVPGQPAGELGGLHRRQHFHPAEGGAGEAALRLQPAPAERGAHERRHRQFGRRGDRHA